jgi:hypothetical protein
MKPIQGLFWAERSLKIFPMGTVEAGIPLTYQLMDPLCKELPGPLLEPLHHHGLDVFVQPESKVL